MRAIEFLLENKITLNDLYQGNLPDRDEIFWDEVSTGELDKPFEIHSMPKHKLKIMLLSQYRVEHIDELFDLLDDDQKEIVEKYTKDPKLSNKIIVISDNRIIDGNHRALAAAMKDLSINYIDLADEENISELYDPQTSFKLEWDDSFGPKEMHATAYDRQGRTVNIDFVPVGKNMTEVEFTRGGSYDVTGRGDATFVFATVLQAFKEYLQGYRPKYIIFSAKEGSRFSLYQKLVNRFASTAGYKQFDLNRLKPETRERIGATGTNVILLHDTTHGVEESGVSGSGSSPHKWQGKELYRHLV